MSINAMGWVWKNSSYKGNQLLMMLALADQCNDEGWCWPGVATLAKKARLTKRSAQRVLSQLEDDGEIVRVLFAGTATGSGNTNRYYLKKYRDSIGLKTDTRDDTIDTPSLSRDDTGDTQGVTAATPQGVTLATPKPLLEPSLEPIKQKSNSAGASTAAADRNKKQSTVPELTKEEFEEMVQTVKNVLNANGVRCMTLVHLLRGTSKRLKQYNMADPVSADELRRFGKWWAHQFPTASPPLSPEKLQHHFLAFREAEAKNKSLQVVVRKDELVPVVEEEISEEELARRRAETAAAVAAVRGAA